MAAATAMTAAAVTAMPLPKSPFLNIQPRNTNLQVAIRRFFPKTLGVAAAPRTITPRAAASASSPSASASSPSASASPTSFHGPCFVLGDNIDTDQIIPAEHLTLVPSKPDEYRKLGSLALIGLPAAFHSVPFITPPSTTTRFPIIIAGANFGCGSSREHAPVALGAAGCQVVVAEYYARIFFRNSVATGEIYPLESEATGLWKECTTGDVVTVDLAGSRLINHTTGIEYKLKPIGDAGPVIEAGGIFAYARKTGMIASKA